MDSSVGYASNGFDSDSWFGLGPTGTPTLAPTAVSAAVLDGARIGVRQRSGDDLAGAEWRSTVCAARYSWPCSWALGVVACESTWNPNAYNPDGPYLGLFQIWIGYGGNLYDPATNIETAARLYEDGGAGHWPNCP